MTRMARVTASASRQLTAAPDQVIALLRDYRNQRKALLPAQYTAYRVEAGGTGSGTVIGYHFAAGGRERDYRLRVEESDGVLREKDELSSFVSTWTVTPSGTGSTVTLECVWDGAGGIGGFFEGVFAPLGMKRIFGEILTRLEAAL
jgi:hypothetical protein